MTTSGSVDFNPQRNTIIYRALRMVGAYSAESNPSSAQITDAGVALDSMLKEWQMDGLLWLRQKATLFLDEGQTTYLLGNSSQTGFAHCATSYVQTTLSTAASSGDGTVSVTSATGITNGYFLGIENDDGTIEWFYATISGTTATLFSDSSVSVSDTLGADCAAGNVVYCYATTAQIERPMDVYSATLKAYNATAENGTEVSVMKISRNDYLYISSKTSTGKIVQYAYDPQLNAGKLYVWPTADSCGDKLVLDIDKPISDMDSSTDTFELPIEAINAITFNLALELEPEYPLSVKAFQKLKFMADSKKATLLTHVRDHAPTTFELEL